MTNNPCCPSRISLMNVKIANQNTGVMSTPKAGGICPFTSLNNGSDGHATTAHGNSLRFVSGYQDATTRHSIAKDIKFKNGPSAAAVGATHASVSANNKPLPEVIVAPTVSESDEAIVGSTIDRDDGEDDDVGGAIVAARGDAGATKADATPIIVAIIQHRTAARRCILISVSFRKLYLEKMRRGKEDFGW